MTRGDEQKDGTQWGFVDLWITLGCIGLAGLTIVTPVLRDSFIRVILTLGFVLLIPGYAFVAALFPGRYRESATDGSRGIDWFERMVFSVGASIAIVSILGLLLNFTPWGIRLTPVFLAVGGISAVFTGIAALRRMALPAEERLTIPSPMRVRGMVQSDDRTDAILNVVLAVSLLLAASSVAFAVGAPAQGEQYTEFYLLTENETGQLTASDYPNNLTRGEAQSLVAGVTNREGEPTTYTVIVELQAVTVTEGVVKPQTRSQLGVWTTELAPGETRQFHHMITPTLTGQNLRLSYHLYRGTTPNSSSEPYRSTHLWVNVTSPQTTS